MRLATVSAVLGAILSAVAALALTDTWSVDVRRPGAVQRTYLQGESWDIAVTLRDGLAPLSLTNATATFYWYTNSVQNVWWTNAAAVAGSVVTAAWTPAMDVGASSYPFWIGIWTAGATSPLWRVSGNIRLLTSPGFTPNALALPQAFIDFDSILVTNAPWATPADLLAISNALAGAVHTVAADGSNHVIAAVSGLPTREEVTNIVAGASVAVEIEVSCEGGYVVSNWWSPTLTASYRDATPAGYATTNGYLIYSQAITTQGFIDWDLAATGVAGFPGEVAWSVDNTGVAAVVGSRLVAAAPGVVTLTGDSYDVRRSKRVPINYAIVGQTVSALDRLLPGSAAHAASAPILAMASNYLATTTEPLIPRPNSWNTNEVFRTNYLAVAKWQSPISWNPDCWLTNAPRVFASTAIATGSSPAASPNWHGTLIAPRIIVGARHTGLNVGSTKWFLTPEGALTNAVVQRLVSLNSRQTMIPLGVTTIPIAEPDIVLGYLSRAMPSNMVARVATSAQLAAAFGGAAGISAGGYVQGVAFDQHLGASILEFSGFGASSVGFRRPLLPQGAAVSALFHPAHPGDSGRPVFLLWGDQAVILCTYHYAHSGSSIPYYIDKIAAACAAEGQPLTYIDFEEVP